MAIIAGVFPVSFMDAETVLSRETRRSAKWPRPHAREADL
jgi:hypothetical protein